MAKMLKIKRGRIGQLKQLREIEERNEKKREKNKKKREIKKKIDNMTVDRLKYYLDYLGLEKKGTKEELKTRLRGGCRPEILEKPIYK